MKKRLSFILLSSLVFSMELKSQQLVWATSCGNDGNYVVSGGLAIDQEENVYSMGKFSGTIDLDPGSAVFNLSCPIGDSHAYIQKLDQDGNFIWAKKIRAAFEFITCGPNGDLYISGIFSDTIDVDPGPGVYNLITKGVSSPFILKLNNTGDFQWALALNTPYGEINEIQISDNHIFACGYFRDTLFTPFDTVVSMGESDAFYLRLSDSGNLDWVKIMGGHHRDEAWHIESSDFGEVYISGIFRDTIDLNAGTGFFSAVSPTYSMCGTFLIKTDLEGDFIWGTSFKSFQYPLTQNLIIDEKGDILFTGKSTFTEDFDPGPDTYNLTLDNDLYLLKLSSSGDLKWVRVFEVTGQSYFEGIAVDKENSIYLEGLFNLTFDYDPGPDQLLDSTGLAYKNFVEKIDSSGQFIWVETFNSSSLHYKFIEGSLMGNLYLCGTYTIPTDFAPGPEEYILDASYDYTAFVVKWNNPLLSSNESAEVHSISCYPNPTAGELTLNIPSDQQYDISVYNALGENIRSYEDYKDTRIILIGPVGVYFIEVKASKGSTTIFKIVKR